MSTQVKRSGRDARLARIQSLGGKRTAELHPKDRSWGFRMLGAKGGRVMATRGLEHLRRISPLGVAARKEQAALVRRRKEYERQRAQGLVP